MAFMAYIYVYPYNFDVLSLTYEVSNGTQTTLSRSNFTSNSANNRLEYNGPNITSIVSANSSSYPTPRITEELVGDTQYYYVDFRPEHLYALGNDNISTTDYIYVTDLSNPTYIYNSQGWASNNAFDWSYGAYSNFYNTSYNSSTQKYDISCTECTDSSLPKKY